MCSNSNLEHRRGVKTCSLLEHLWPIDVFYIKLCRCKFCVSKPCEPFDDKWRKALNWSPPEKKKKRKSRDKWRKMAEKEN